jgi:hypothetical protein
VFYAVKESEERPYIMMVKSDQDGLLCQCKTDNRATATKTFTKQVRKTRKTALEKEGNNHLTDIHKQDLVGRRKCADPHMPQYMKSTQSEGTNTTPP